MLNPRDQVRLCEGRDGFVGAAAGAEVGDLDYQRCGYYFVVFAADFDLLFGFVRVGQILGSWCGLLTKSWLTAVRTRQSSGVR